MKKRLIEFLAYLEVGQNKFEAATGIARGAISKMSEDNMTTTTLMRIVEAYPELNYEWLLFGEGEMLKTGTAIARGKNATAVSGSTSGGVFGGVVHGSADNVNGSKHVTHHHNGGKDIAIDELQQKDRQMLQTLIDQLDNFHNVGERRDNYVQKQDEWIANIIKQSYLRNKENMERIDNAMAQQNVVIAQQNKLIEMAFEQSKRTQDRADVLIEMLIAKK
jgi:hypothetical protein